MSGTVCKLHTRMLTTLFTGHTLDLTDVVAIGPLMQQNKQHQWFEYRRTLCLRIFCKHTVTIQHDHLAQEIANKPSNEQADAWKKAHDTLRDKREDLILQWGASRLKQDARSMPAFTTAEASSQRIRRPINGSPEEAGADRQH